MNAATQLCAICDGTGCDACAPLPVARIDLDAKGDPGGLVEAFVDAHPEGGTLEAIGEACGLTREAIRQIELGAKRKLEKRLPMVGVRADDVLELLATASQRGHAVQHGGAR